MKLKFWKKEKEQINEPIEKTKDKIIHIFPNRFDNKVICGKYEKLVTNIISIPVYYQEYQNNSNVCFDCKNNIRP